jgi:hypothetical protein
LTSCVALFALALQLLLSFGHIHRKDILGQKTPVAAALVLVSPSDPATPPEPAGHDHEDGYCAIYAINALIGSAHPAEPPSLPVPPQLAGAAFSVAAQLLPTERRHLLAQARAPPHA